jgi:hypothetical protein
MNAVNLGAVRIIRLRQELLRVISDLEIRQAISAILYRINADLFQDRDPGICPNHRWSSTERRTDWHWAENVMEKISMKLKSASHEQRW